MTGDLLSELQLWTKSLHVISVIAWMAGIFYLPRLFVYHTENVGFEGESHRLFMTMEQKLFAIIMTPAMVASWLFGLLLVLTPGVIDWGMFWPWIKAVMVLAMTWFHFWLGARRKELAAGSCKVTGRGFRLMNEVPTVLMFVIVIMVIARPA